MFDTLMKLDKDREVLDFYATDKRATKELLIRENFREIIYEPACGQGHIAKVLEEHGYKVKAEDICYRGYGNERKVDFFTIKENTLDIEHAIVFNGDSRRSSAVNAQGSCLMDTINEIKSTGLKATLPRMKILEIFQKSGQRHMIEIGRASCRERV